MNKILHIAPSYKPAFFYGGPTVSVGRLAEEQARHLASVSVFTTTANGNEELDVPTGVPQDVDGVQVTYFNRLTGDHGHLSPALLWAFWRKADQYPILHLHSWWNWVVFGCLLVCRLKGRPNLVSPHGMLSPYTLRTPFRRRFQKTVGRWLLAKSVLHATSKLEKKELEALHPGLPVLLAPNIIYLPATLPQNRPQAAGKPLKLLFLSRIDPKKGLDILLKALSHIPAPDWQLIIAGATGGPYQKQLLQLAKSLGLEQQIRWAGWTAGEEKWDLLKQADLMILPSHNENFANVVIEALAVGTPVVISNQVGLHAYVRERELGWVGNPNPEAFTTLLLEACSAAELRAQISRRAPALVRADFEPGKVVQLYFKHYRSLIQPGKK